MARSPDSIWLAQLEGLLDGDDPPGGGEDIRLLLPHVPREHLPEPPGHGPPGVAISGGALEIAVLLPPPLDLGRRPRIDVTVEPTVEDGLLHPAVRPQLELELLEEAAARALVALGIRDRCHEPAKDAVVLADLLENVARAAPAHDESPLEAGSARSR